MAQISLVWFFGYLLNCLDVTTWIFNRTKIPTLPVSCRWRHWRHPHWAEFLYISSAPRCETPRASGFCSYLRSMWPRWLSRCGPTTELGTTCRLLCSWRCSVGDEPTAGAGAPPWRIASDFAWLEVFIGVAGWKNGDNLGSAYNMNGELEIQFHGILNTYLSWICSRQLPVKSSVMALIQWVNNNSIWTTPNLLDWNLDQVAKLSIHRTSFSVANPSWWISHVATSHKPSSTPPVAEGGLVRRK